ncbi:monocarboxylate transporter 14-like [Chironomus tepperi]|uniref:monocarboxylate transporter 14-like n=1 Tax=Chironomus tepperi TaxID=113505 RepID=UPI00391F4714
MVIDLQITNNSIGKPRKIFPDSHGEVSHNIYYQDQLALIREHLLNPTEVKFNVEDDGTKRKRLTTISSEISDVSEESVSSTSTIRDKKKIPDGGYGWVIVFASLMVSLIADGISFSFGLLYSELLDYFEEGTTKTAWIGSLFMSVPLISGPIMSNLVDKYGCQKMTMIGGILGCAGFVLSAFSNSVEMLYITFGVIAGVGLGVIYVTAVVSIAFWFESKRNFATGIGASGTGIGTFLYAPFTQWLISYYGWRGATLILGGTLLNFCVFGALMIDPEWLVEENKLEARSQSMQTFSNSSMCLDEIKKLIETGAKKEDLLDTLVTNVNTEANQQIYDPDIIHAKKYQSELLLPTFISNNEMVNFDDLRPNSRLSLRPDQLISPETNSETEQEKKCETKDSVDDLKMENNRMQCKIASIETLNTSEKASSTDRDIDLSSLNLAINQNEHILIDFHDEFYTSLRSGLHGSRYSLNDKIFSNNSFTNDIKNEIRGNSLNIIYESHAFPINYRSFLQPNEKLKSIHERDEKLPVRNKGKNSHKKRYSLSNTGNLKRNPSLRYSNYLKNMRVHRNSIHYRGAMLSTHRYRLKASSCPNIYRNSMTTIARENNDVWYDDFVDIIKSVFDFSLFLRYKFGMMSLSTLFLFIWYIIPYFYITEYLLKFNYTEEASAYLISIIGIFNTFGMVALGWIGDQPWCNVTKTYAFCLFLCGLSMFAIPLATWSYTFLMTLCAIFGVTFGSSFSFTPMITSRLVDMDDFTLAYGLILLVQGIGSLVGPPLSGWIFDVTNRWDYSFYLGGIFVTLSGVLAYVIGPLEVEGDGDGNSNNNAKDYQLKKPI